MPHWDCETCGAIRRVGTGRSGGRDAVWTALYDVARTGANTRESVLTPANVNPQTFGRVGRLGVEGCVVAQPLYVPGVAIPGVGPRNVVYVATASNMPYAFDADNFTPYFTRSFGTPVSSYDIDPDRGYFDFPRCDGVDDVGPIGIVGTPVIDLAGGALFLVAASGDDAPTQQNTLYAVQGEPPHGRGSRRAGRNRRRFRRRDVQFAVLPYSGWLFAYDTSLTTGNNAEGIVNAGDAADSVLQIDADTLPVVAKTSFPNEANNWDYSNDIDLGSSRLIPLPGRPYAVAAPAESLSGFRAAQRGFRLDRNLQRLRGVERHAVRVAGRRRHKQ